MPVREGQYVNVLRVMAIQPSVTGVPRDSIVNTWHFLPFDNQDPVGDLELAVANLTTFYNALGVNFRPSTLVEPEMLFKGYNLGHVEPREAIVNRLNAVTRSAQAAMPEEVAIVTSFYSNRNLKRRRGRAYLGPWGIPAVGITAGRTHVSDATRTLIATQTKALVDRGIAQEVRLAVLSPTDQMARSVSHGWVDDAFDTQRSRGPRGELRTPWVAAD
jgi:hypothetical protein